MPFTEAIRLAGLPGAVPSEALRYLLERGAGVRLRYEGHGMWPAIRSGTEIELQAPDRLAPSVGCVALVRLEEGGLGLRRLLERDPAGWIGAQDADPRRERLDEAAILAVRSPNGSMPEPSAERHRWSAPLLRRLAELQEVLDPGSCALQRSRDPARSVRRKYEGQAGAYERSRGQGLSRGARSFLDRLARGSRVLIVGCGTGTEMAAALERGLRPHGIDFAPRMVEVARERFPEGEVTVEEMDVRRLSLPAGSFEAVLFTPQVFSFLPGRATRRRVLASLFGVLAPGGRLFLSVRRCRGPWQWALSRLYAMRAETGVEPGDWFTTFPVADGGIERSYVHLYGSGELRRDLRSAGFHPIHASADEWTARRPIG